MARKNPNIDPAYVRAKETQPLGHAKTVFEAYRSKKGGYVDLWITPCGRAVVRGINARPYTGPSPRWCGIRQRVITVNSCWHDNYTVEIDGFPLRNKLGQIKKFQVQQSAIVTAARALHPKHTEGYTDWHRSPV
jgi:hypothetical protein